jgi:cyclophilin family peptidyl-prolyl cis-trans isomerase/HEAT repeat protein
MSALRTVLLAVAATACAGTPAPVSTPEPGVATEWERVLAAEDARAGTAADLAVLRGALRSRDAGTRALAVRAMGRIERRDLAPDIVPMLRDPDAAVRTAAAHALADVTRDSVTADARNQLLAVLSDAGDADFAGAVAESLGRLRHDSAAAHTIATRLRPLLLRDDAARSGALRGLHFLARQPPGRTAVAALAPELGGLAGSAAAARERALALATIATSGSATADVVSRALQDGDWTVRREAVVAAGTLSDTAAVRALLLQSTRDSAHQVRYEATRTYARRLAATHGCGPVLSAIDDGSTHVAVLAIGLAGTTCRLQADVRQLDSIARTAMSESWHRGAHATAALAAIRPTDVAAHIDRLSAHESPFARTYAARAAAAARAVQRLTALAADPHPNVRTAAVEGLAAVAGRAADSVYSAQLGSTESELLQAAARALEGSRDARVPERLLDALERVTALRAETSRDARDALLVRLKELGSATHAARLRPYLTDFDDAIAHRAAEVLTAWTGETAESRPEALPRLPLPSHDDLQQLARSRFVIELDAGTVQIALLPIVAPTNAWRFARLARTGYFDGLTVHRVVPNFVVQGGSPGANEYSGDAPFTRDELGEPNWRGTVGLSTRGRDTGDAQFYINLVDNVRLDHDYTIFAVVTDGMDVVDALLEGAVIRRVSEIR